MKSDQLQFPLLLADIGSSTGDWALWNSPHSIEFFKTDGYSPVFSEESRFEKVYQSIRPHLTKPVKSLLYFGTGCYRSEPQKLMEQILSEQFPEAFITVRSDLEAAALAALGDSPGWIAILGTGSSLAFWNNNTLQLKDPPIHAIPDAGSGTHIGKLVLQSYFCNDLPLDLKNGLAEAFPVVSDLNESILSATHPDKLTAQLASWVIRNAKDHPFLDRLIRKAYDAFIVQRILPAVGSLRPPIHFCGSIAWYGKDWLTEEMDRHGLMTGSILRAPIEELTAYFKDRLTWPKTSKE
jgi:hypothetical protein